MCTEVRHKAFVPCSYVKSSITFVVRDLAFPIYCILDFLLVPKKHPHSLYGRREFHCKDLLYLTSLLLVDAEIISSFLLLQPMLQWIVLFRENLIVQVYLWNKFLKVVMLGQRVPAFIILINVAKSLFTEGMPADGEACVAENLFPTPLASTVSCQTCWLPPIWLKTVSQCNYDFYFFSLWMRLSIFHMFAHLNFILCAPPAYCLLVSLFGHWSLSYAFVRRPSCSRGMSPLLCYQLQIFHLLPSLQFVF